MNSVFCRSGLSVLALATLLGIPGRADAGGNLVVNGGFETGDFTGWTKSGNVANGVVGVYAGSPYAHSGNYGAGFGTVGVDGFLSQSIATTVGHTYEVSFWLSSDGETPNDFSAAFGSVVGLSQTNLASFAFTQYTFNVVAASAASVLQFGYRNDPGYLGLDDVSVTDVTPPPAAVPEPSSVVMLGLGTLGLFGVVKRSRRSRKPADR